MQRHLPEPQLEHVDSTLAPWRTMAAYPQSGHSYLLTSRFHRRDLHAGQRLGSSTLLTHVWAQHLQVLILMDMSFHFEDLHAGQRLGTGTVSVTAHACPHTAQMFLCIGSGLVVLQIRLSAYLFALNARLRMPLR